VCGKYIDGTFILHKDAQAIKKNITNTSFGNSKYTPPKN
jgi:hypothetical protein